jgi:hypothetical protein
MRNTQRADPRFCWFYCFQGGNYWFECKWIWVYSQKCGAHCFLAGNEYQYGHHIVPRHNLKQVHLRKRRFPNSKRTSRKCIYPLNQASSYSLWIPSKFQCFRDHLLCNRVRDNSWDSEQFWASRGIRFTKLTQLAVDKKYEEVSIWWYTF